MMKQIIGFNTGGFSDSSRRTSKETIHFLRSLGCNAIELNPIDVAGLKSLDNIDKSDFDGFWM